MPTLCPFALITGSACPGCGMTRAMVHLLRTEWSASWTLHPVAPILVLAALTALVWWAGSKRLGWKPIGPRVLDQGLIGMVSVLVGVWAIRWIGDSLPPVSGWLSQ